MHGLLKLNEGEIMKKALSFLSVLIIMILFSGCTKIPEKTDIEEILNKIEEERAAKCGDWIKDKWEECDFEGTKSCSAYDSGTIGPAKCQNCKLDLSECKIKEICDAEFCSSNGECKEIRYLNEIFCDCVNNRTGANCEKCYDGFFKKDDSCVTDNCSLIKCLDYEKCDNDSGVAVCVCRSDTQDPNDCSKCLPGYYWDDSNWEKCCINEKTVACIIPNNLPDYTYIISSWHKIYYSSESGWSNPPECEWVCEYNKNYIGEECVSKAIDSALKIFMNKDGEIVFFKSNAEIYKLKKDKLNFSINLPVLIVQDVKILPDGNYFYIGSNYDNVYNPDHFAGIVTPDGKEIIKYNEIESTGDPVLTFTKKGRIFNGDIEYTFPDFRKIHLNASTESESVTISDDSGNLFTIYTDGNVFAVSSSGEPLWNIKFEKGHLSRAVAADAEKNIYIPFINGINGNGIHVVSSKDGSILNDFLTNDDTDAWPTILFGKNIILARTGFNYYWLDKNKNISGSFSTGYLATISSILINDIAYICKAFTLYYFKKPEIITYEYKNISSNRLFHHNGRLFVSDDDDKITRILKAPGTPEGDWPQYLHDSMQSGSLADIEFVDPPSAPVALTPEDSTVFNTNSVTFSWAIDSGDPEIKYTLLLRDSAGYDEVYAGPEIGLSTATVSDLAAGTYEWRVVSKDENGSLNVSDARTFTVE
jgi:hypothetical protein